MIADLLEALQEFLKIIGSNVTIPVDQFDQAPGSYGRVGLFRVE
jgi:hypothetical protein